jgi:uncharacterized membrane protein
LADEQGETENRPVDRQIIVVAVGLLLILALIAFTPDVSPPGAGGLTSERLHARIEALTPESDTGPPTARIVVIDGPHAGQTVDAFVEGPGGQLLLPDYAAGDEVVATIDKNPDGTESVSVIDRWRLPLIEQLLLGFAFVTIVVAGWRGARALVALGLTLVLTVKVLIPLLLDGWSPVALAVGLGIVITVGTLMLTQGPSRSTLAAILGTTAGLAISGILAIATTAAARFTLAQGSETIVTLQQIGGGRIDLSGLLLAAVIFGGLGVLNDVATSQAVTVDELRLADATLSRSDLYRRTMNVGVAHLAATVNTLVFAYLGTALPLLVLLALQIRALNLAINDEVIAVEVVRTIVGSIGVILAVPITTAVAAWLTPAPVAHPPATRGGVI